jgi:ABC-type branched-subunit amino acid transport system substrate-binding protein
MQTDPTFTARERRVLLLYGLAFLAAGALFLLVQLARTGLPTAAAPLDQAEIAVLAPLSGEQAAYGQAVLEVVGRAVISNPYMSSLPVRQINVVGYDTRGTPNGAAAAALMAARNPAAAAVIGPLDASQALAASETLGGHDLALLTPASNAPALPVSSPSLARIPANADAQASAMVDLLTGQLQASNVYVIVENSFSTVQLYNAFVLAANPPDSQGQPRLNLVAVKSFDRGQVPPDVIGPEIANAQAVVYFGRADTARVLLNTLNQLTDLPQGLPFIGSDQLVDPALLPLPGDRLAVYYTSPFLNLAGLPEEQRGLMGQALGNQASAQFSHETARATWLALAALAASNPDQTPRQAVWQNLGFVQAPGPGGNLMLVDGQGIPAKVYVYQVQPGVAWELAPPLAVFQEQ